ncbi:MAG: anaerobic sulfatase maturase [Rikenellaceae bacterium]|nr:anaerobic sulfatase maturase [Rikenellaceae bacterium]MCL2692716.1 anaerobic sulfatase maturase [Rikenellaceae bacterium]
MLNRLFTYEDAQRATGRTVFASVVKPVGSACNLDCAYCYYLGKGGQSGQPQKMTDSVLEEYVRQYITDNAAEVVSFCWHGGEPLLAGIGFFERAVAYQKKHGRGRRIENTVQTNGTLLDRAWCSLFRRNGFLVGISIDGPEDIHDAYRRDRAGGGTFAKVMHAVSLMREEGVEFNTLSTVNRMSEGRGTEVYEFLKSVGSRYMQFMPVVEHTVGDGCRAAIVPPGTPGSQRAEWAVSAAGFGQFMVDIFDRWVAHDVGNYFVPFFDAVLAQYVGLTPALCTLGETCGRALAVESNGDVYACDHFVFPEYRLGNIAHETMADMVKCQRQMWFGLAKRNELPGQCKRCEWLFACRGECPKHRFDMAENGEKGLNSLCEGYRMFFAHADACMKFMAGELAARRSPANVMSYMKKNGNKYDEK